MSTPIIPTRAQESACLRLCANLTTMDASIYVVRIDERIGEVFILAGEEIEVLIPPDEQWRYS
ncbi:MAG: hypothetical protein DCF22_18330 [Leptolyngbya sp.]|nr:MAG: hypothetical protein DCF22_18330 [Leptolyngbya sp.]